MGDSYQRLTKKGYDFYEVASAFQSYYGMTPQEYRNKRAPQN